MRHPLIMPELGLGDEPITVSLWLVDRGHDVSEGDRLLEVQGESVTVDLPAPVSGRLVQKLVSADDPLKAGQVLGYIEADG